MCFGVLMGAVIIYFVSFIYFERPLNDDTALAIAGLLSCTFFVGGWVLTWNKMITWSARRVTLTISLIFISLFTAGVFYILMPLMNQRSGHEMGIFVGSLVWVMTWLIGTAIIWQENAKERGERLRRLGIHAVACPDCGYNLTGLKEAKCPECGAAYTLDQLYASITEQRAELGGE